MKAFTFVDLFCGAGGLALGFTQAGFKSVYAVDSDAAAANTYELNFRHKVWKRDIQELDQIPVKADVIIGGPPCQGFSPLGKMIPSQKHPHMNKLWQEYFRMVRQVDPVAFVVENVPEFLRSTEFAALQDEAKRLGYSITAGVLNAVDYGVPQRRKRAFVVGVKGAESRLPEPTGERLTVWHAIHDLPLQPDGKNWHIGRNPTQKSLERYKCILPGENRFDLMRKRPDLTPKCWLNKPTGSTDVFGRLEWTKPALTIRTEFFKPEKGRYLHPAADRPLTHREAARIQTFPDDFIFSGSKVEVARQIGNAVPSKLAREVALALSDVIAATREKEEFHVAEPISV